ncbi:MAG TPA: hypothetical protein VND19_11660 [Acetobacteraceae bacterium]|nr:hypothetical protein [Acetobacteraceae bacterium]
MSGQGGSAAAALRNARQDTSCGDDAADATAQPCPLPIHWIEIELIGEDGKGVPDQAYLIVTPDGAEHRGRTDARGWGRLDGIPGGTCRISFTELDKDAWESA